YSGPGVAGPHSFSHPGESYGQVSGLCRDETAAPGPGRTTTIILGTPDDMAPEQARDAHAADIRADIYSLGRTLFHALAGKLHFPEGNLVRNMLPPRQRAGAAAEEVQFGRARRFAADRQLEAGSVVLVGRGGIGQLACGARGFMGSAVAEFEFCNE